MSVSRQIPVFDRGLDSYLFAMELVRERLKKGETVHVFPEMTRCPRGFSGTLAFSTMPFHIARQVGIPILPIAFKGTDGVWPRGQMGLNFRSLVKGSMLATIDPSKFSSAAELKSEVQRANHRGFSMILRPCICIPTYNNPLTIQKVIEECLSLYEFPIIVVDDGSSSPVSKVLSHPRVTFIRHSENLGKGKALQTAFKEAVLRATRT